MVANLTPGGPESERSRRNSFASSVTPKQTPINEKQSANIPASVKQIHFAHENFNLVVNIMLGVKKAVDSTFDMVTVTPKDFKIKCKY